jgi:hypothetical protein
MLLLQSNKLVNINTSEDTGVIHATKSLDKLNSQFAVKDEVLLLIMHTSKLVPEHYGKYNFKVTQSYFKDDSSLGSYYEVFNTKGQAISRMILDGYSITIDGHPFTNQE